MNLYGIVVWEIDPSSAYDNLWEVIPVWAEDKAKVWDRVSSWEAFRKRVNGRKYRFDVVEMRDIVPAEDAEIDG